MAIAGKIAKISGEYIGTIFSLIAFTYMKVKNKISETNAISMVASVFFLVGVIVVKLEI